MFKYKPEQSVIKMSEGETVQLHSFNTFNNFVNNNHGSNGYAGNQGDHDAKKYKLRLKFDGSCALEVVRLNGGHFQNLTHLDISGNSAEKLDLRSLGRLEWLCCSNNSLEVLTLSGTSLSYLDCSHNYLQSISIDPVPNNLSTLQASFNNLEELPSWTWMVPELFIIHASNNRLRQVDCKYQNSLTNLPIRELHLHSNRIEFVSKDFIQRATRLKIINISQNIVQLMPNFPRRSSVQELYMSRNRLEDTDERSALDFLVECSSIRRLHLAFNKIKQINEKCLSTWKNLEELILCGNRIRTLSPKLSSLMNLRVLRIHSNQLETAPNLTKMPSLKVVDLSHNNIRKINLENLISGGNLTYLDISCNERLTLDPEKLNNPSKRPMNLVEVTNPRKTFIYQRNNMKRDFPANPPWELGFSELPDRNHSLCVSQFRDVNLCNGKSALFGLFDGGEGNQAPKSITKSIAKIYTEERNIEDSLKFSLKYTLLNSLRNFRQQGHTKPVQGALCLLSIHEETTLVAKQSYTLDVALVGSMKCLLIQSGKKINYIADNLGGDKRGNEDREEDNKENGSTKSDSSNDLNGVSTRMSSTIQDPYIVSIPITPSAEYLILANQSVWENVSEAELMEELEKHRQKKSVLLAKRLTDLAQSHSCHQSLSLILIRFKWNSSRGLVINRISSKDKSVSTGEFGPLSYYSGSSECSDDITNPLTSVITPDSAIESDRSSGTCSFADNDSNKTNPKRRFIKTITTAENNNNKAENADAVSLANTSVSQMSVEQFRCWEYMLEQNTRLLFKKELDSLSKGVFQRNQRLRKSVHFPFKQELNDLSVLNSTESQRSNTKSQTSSKSSNPGFYTLSKAKSLNHLFGDEPKTINSGRIYNQNPKIIPQSHFPLFTNANAGFLESVKSARGTILGGPNAAYFGSTQRTPHRIPPTFDEIQELRNQDSMEQDTRLKKYWDSNKITEL